ncbi:thiol:disulfide interchange protein DsbA/DsbL [Roseateles sp. BYS78W]|uniref:Thiol:disulfide interchange protein n=1 Tax=Pelomonas candidula TaxID=3299025 RepID=A0ABW7HA28_9BURK
MKRRDATLTLAAAGLASTTPAAWAQGGPVEGRHYQRLAQPLPGAPGKVEVIEFFFYKCPHCFAFDPLLGDWLHRLPPDVTFRRIPVGQQAMLKLHARMFYALEAMGALTPTVHAGIFNAFHRMGIDATDEAGVVDLVGKLGVDQAKFKQAFSSFGVQGKLAQGQKMAELAGADSVPTLVIGGRYRTGPGLAGEPSQSEAANGQAALAVADFLIKLSRGKG